MSWLEKVLAFVLEEVVGAAWTRPIRKLARFARWNARRTLRRHPVAGMVLLASAGVVWAFPGIVPVRVGVSETCPTIRAEGGELYGPSGDSIRYDGGERRQCVHGHLAALEFFDHFRTAVEPGRPPVGLVSAGFIVNEAVAALGKADEWHEYSLFADGNHFVWKDQGARDEKFLTGSCAPISSAQDDATPREVRHGFILESKDLRTYPEQISHDTWTLCNRLDPVDPKNRFCNFVRLQLFIPNMGPRRWCKSERGLLDLLARETYRKTFVDGGDLDQLRALAREGAKRATASDVSEGRYQGLTRDAPKVCMRWVDDNHYLNQADSAWQDFADVAAVWCDQ